MRDKIQKKTIDSKYNSYKRDVINTVIDNKEKYCSKAITLPKRMEHHERVFTRTQYLPKRPVQQHGLRARHRHLGTVMGLSYCVSKNQISGKWQVGLASNKKVVKSFDTQKEAMSFVRKMAIAKASSAQAKKSKPSAKAKLVKK